MDIFGLREKIIEAIGAVSYDAWFKAQPEVMDGHRVKFKAREAAKIHSPNYGILVIEASSRFFRDKIIEKFGETLHRISQAEGYTRLHVISAGEEIQKSEPPLSPEEWSELREVIGRIGKAGRNGSGFWEKAGSGLCGAVLKGKDHVQEEPSAQKPKPAYVYRGNQGLRFSAGGNGCALPKEETPPSDE